MKKNRITILIVMASMALAAMACNNPLLAADAEASDFAAEVEAQVQAALAEAEAAGELEFIAEEEPAVEAPAEESTEEELETVVTEEPTVEPEVTVEPTPEIVSCTNRAEFIADVTVPDGSDFTPGQAFVKTWRLRNSGTCTWTSSYKLVFDHGDSMGGPASLSLPGLVNPGQIVDLSVNLTAPGTVGAYTGYWLLRSNEGALFGIGANANIAFWVEIEVLEEEEEEGPIVLEILPIPVFPIFVSSGGGQYLPNGACFDLDAGDMVGCGSPDADFRYSADLEVGGWPPIPQLKRRVVPVNGATFALFGNDLPTGNECQAMALAGSPFNIQNRVYCFQTTAGKYGRLGINSGDIAGMNFDWATYTFP